LPKRQKKFLKHAKLTVEIQGLEQTLEKKHRQAKEAARVAKGKLTTNTTLTLRDTNLLAEKEASTSQVSTLETEKNALIAENTAVKLQPENLERKVKNVLQSLEAYKTRLRAIANEP
jgi:regulator of replication initiation timing